MYYYTIGQENRAAIDLKWQVLLTPPMGFEIEVYQGHRGNVVVLLITETYVKKTWEGWQHPDLAAFTKDGFFVDWCEASHAEHIRSRYTRIQ